MLCKLHLHTCDRSVGMTFRKIYELNSLRPCPQMRLRSFGSKKNEIKEACCSNFCPQIYFIRGARVLRMKNGRKFYFVVNCSTVVATSWSTYLSIQLESKSIFENERTLSQCFLACVQTSSISFVSRVKRRLSHCVRHKKENNNICAWNWTFFIITSHKFSLASRSPQPTLEITG